MSTRKIYLQIETSTSVLESKIQLVFERILVSRNKFRPVHFRRTRQGKYSVPGPIRRRRTGCCEIKQSRRRGTTRTVAENVQNNCRRCKSVCRDADKMGLTTKVNIHPSDYIRKKNFEKVWNDRREVDVNTLRFERYTVSGVKRRTRERESALSRSSGFAYVPGNSLAPGYNVLCKFRQQILI